MFQFLAPILGAIVSTIAGATQKKEEPPPPPRRQTQFQPFSRTMPPTTGVDVSSGMVSQDPAIRSGALDRFNNILRGGK